MQPNNDPYSTFQPSLSTDQSTDDDASSTIDKETQAVARHVEDLCNQFVTVLNNHDFDPFSPIYQRNKSSHFIAEGGYLFPTDLDLKGYLDLWKHLVAEHPDLWTKIADMTTYVDLKTGFAQVYCNMEITGRPTGLVRKSVAVLDFKREKGDGKETTWRCTRFKGMRGADIANAGEMVP